MNLSNKLSNKDIKEFDKKYNSQEGLGKLCTTLKGMHEVMNARKILHDLILDESEEDASERRMLPLHDFIVAHTWIFDKHGDVRRFKPGFDILEYLDRKRVSLIINADLLIKESGCTGDIFECFYDEILKESRNMLPRIGSVCPVCKKGFDVQNKYDALKIVGSSSKNLDKHAGKPYRDIRRLYNEKSTPEKKIVLLSMDDRYTMDANALIIRGDSFIKKKTKYYHPDCLHVGEQVAEIILSGKTIQEESVVFISLLQKAGYAITNIWPCKDASLKAFPKKWFTIKTTLATFILGQAGSVFSIIIENANDLGLESFGLEDSNLTTEIRGKMLLKDTLAEAKESLVHIRIHLEKFQEASAE